MPIEQFVVVGGVLLLFSHLAAHACVTLMVLLLFNRMAAHTCVTLMVLLLFLLFKVRFIRVIIHKEQADNLIVFVLEYCVFV